MEKLRGIDIEQVYSIEIGSDICCAVESLFPEAKFKRKRVVINRWRKIRDLASDIRFTIYTVVSIGICNFFWQKRQRRGLHPAKGYVTLFPIMNTSDNFDKKYGGLVTSKDVFYALILTDGMHQNLAPLKFLQAIRRLKDSRNIVLVDSFISLMDVIDGIRSRFALKRLALKKRHDRLIKH